MSLPETSVLKMPDAAKFQPKCRPIGTHNLRVATYAAVSMPPASMAMAVAPHTLAFGLSRCDRPNRAPVSTSAIHVPMRSSVIRNRTPRNSSSSVTAAAAMKPNSPAAPDTEPTPSTS